MTAVLAGFLLSRIRSPWGLVATLAAFTTPVSLRLATLFYPEVYVALCCLIGWERIRANRMDSVGWLILGASGWFKNEGLVYLCALAVAMLATAPRGERLGLIPRLLLAAALPLAWHLGCRLAGASLDGYLPVDEARIPQFAAALRRAFQLMFASAWRCAFIYPLAGVALLAPRGRNRSLLAVSIGATLSVVGFAGVFALSDAPDFEWHLDSLERLLWTPSLLLLRELSDCLLSSTHFRNRDWII